jgi:hypothetical protein
MKQNYIVTMPDGSKWKVPVMVIAKHRAKNQEGEPGGNAQQSIEDTIRLFTSDEREIKDWAENNMNWEDVEKFAQKIQDPDLEVDYQEGWVNGEKEIE